MSVNTSSYLYTYARSSKVYFRIRLNSLNPVLCNPSDSHFVRSLRTSDAEHAQWLAIFIKRNLIKEFGMDAINDSTNVTTFHDGMDNDSSPAASRNISNKTLKNLLNVRFGELLGLANGFFNGEPSTLTKCEKAQSRDENTDLENDTDDAQFSNNGTSETEPSDTYDDNNGDSDCIEESYLPPNSDGTNHIQNSVIATLMDQMAVMQGKIDGLTTGENGCDRALAFQPLLSATNKPKTSLNGNKTDLAGRVGHGANPHYSIKTQLALFLLEQQRSVAAGTINDYKTRFGAFFEVIPDTFDCRMLNKEHVQKLKSMLLARTIHATKRSTGKSLDAKTINSYLSNYRTFYSWLLRNVTGVDNNPFAEVSVKKNQLTKVNRRPFDEFEVNRILNYKYARKNEAKGFRDDAKWFLPISFYSGMRLNETSQIRLDDIKKVDGIWCIDLGGSDVKNLSARRVVPIAQYVLDLGLLNYVARLKKNGQTLLFAQIRKGKTKAGNSGWGDPISRWFNRTVLKNIGVDNDEEARRKTTVVFHCVRHTMINTLIRNGVQKHLVKRIVGHAQDDQITLGVYSDVNDISLSLLKKILDENLKWHK